MNIQIGHRMVRFGRWLMAALSVFAVAGPLGASYAQTTGPTPPPSARGMSPPPPGEVLVPPPSDAPAPMSQVAPGTQAPALIAPSPSDAELPLRAPAPGAAPPPLLLAPMTPRQ